MSSRAVIHIVATGESFYNRHLVQQLCERGYPPLTVHVGSRAENIFFKWRSLRRIWKRLGFVEAIRRLFRARREAQQFAAYCEGRPQPPTLKELQAQHGFEIRSYDLLNEGSLIKALFNSPDSIAVLAGCGIVDRAFIAACGKGCLNSHPALLPGLRGVDVIERALIEDVPVGVTVHRVTESVDAGAILFQKRVDPEIGENFLGYKARVEKEQAFCLAQVVIDFVLGTTVESPNDLAKSKICFALPEKKRALARKIFEQNRSSAPQP